MYTLSTDSNKNNVEAFCSDHSIEGDIAIARIRDAVEFQKKQFPDFAGYILVYVDNTRTYIDQYCEERVKSYGCTRTFKNIPDIFIDDVIHNRLYKTRVVVINGYGTILGIVSDELAEDIKYSLRGMNNELTKYDDDEDDDKWM